MRVRQRELELAIGAIEAGDGQRLNVGAGEHGNAGGVRILAIELAGDPAAPAAPGTAADNDGGFQNASTVTLP